MNLNKINFIEKLINWIHEKTSEKQFLIFSSILVGVSAGLAAVILKLFVFFIRQYFLEDYLFRFDYKYLYLVLPLIGIGIAILIVKYFFKNQLSRGNTSILFSIAKRSSFLPFHQMYSHVITSGLTIGFGGSAGLESPIVSTGSAIGSNFARTYKLSYKERTLLLAAGAAGGIAGAFNAPIAGVLFALEVILIDMSIGAFIPLLIAAASGALLSKIILDESILLFFKLKQPFDYHYLFFYILLGLLAGIVSLYYVNFFDKVETKFAKIKSRFTKWLIGGITLAFLFALFPSLFGEGYESIKSLSEFKTEDLFKNSLLANFINDKWTLLIFITITLLLKAVATGITLGIGGNGGNFAPSLFVGAYLGFVFSYFLNVLGFDNIPVSNFTIVAMAGILSGVFHAPLTGIFLIAEITGGYELIIPLMVVSSISYVIVKYFHPESLDVKRLKEKGAIVSDNKDTSILSKIDAKAMIETDFSTIHFKANLRDIVESIKHSKRNIFPVVKKNNKLLGIIYLDNIREEMFNPDLYDKITARELMRKPAMIIDVNEDIFLIMKKFEESGQWNLPVIDEGIYVGFLSKSSILDMYRHELLVSV
ncbi:MAG: chloride channel protein [Bacteroidota bacterium]|nr:chloride channel protein [Bacteroidota bacterium]MDP3145681.1 chloride channel protein [Bacteroidota bacterium]